MDISREMGREEVGSAKERACGGLLFVVLVIKGVPCGSRSTKSVCLTGFERTRDGKDKMR